MHERALLKILANSTGQHEPILSEIKPPQIEGQIICKIKGPLVASRDSELFIRQLVESYEDDDVRLQNAAKRAMRKAFLHIITRVIGRKKMLKFLHS